VAVSLDEVDDAEDGVDGGVGDDAGRRLKTWLGRRAA